MAYRGELVALGAIAIMAIASKPALANFSAGEFGIWYPLVDNDLLTKLDRLRDEWGSSISVSPVQGGVGRADDTESQHNVINTGGLVKAIDIFPSVNGEPLLDGADVIRFVELAKSVGFTGIGVYQDTIFKNTKWVMVHLDTRDSDRVATWSRIDGQYFAIEEGYYA